jgi:hypothetical protein
MEGVDKRKRAMAVENLGYQASVKLALINLNLPELKINIRDVRTYPPLTRISTRDSNMIQRGGVWGTFRKKTRKLFIEAVFGFPILTRSAKIQPRIAWICPTPSTASHDFRLAHGVFQTGATGDGGKNNLDGHKAKSLVTLTRTYATMTSIHGKESISWGLIPLDAHALDGKCVPVSSHEAMSILTKLDATQN